LVGKKGRGWKENLQRKKEKLACSWERRWKEMLAQKEENNLVEDCVNEAKTRACKVTTD